MNDKINTIISNLYESITILTDARILLEQSEITKEYLEKFAEFEKQCHNNIDYEKSNEIYETIVDYEQSIGIAAFLVGFQKGVQSVKAIEDKNFVENMLNMLMKPKY